MTAEPTLLSRHSGSSLPSEVSPTSMAIMIGLWDVILIAVAVAGFAAIGLGIYMLLVATGVIR